MINHLFVFIYCFTFLFCIYKCLERKPKIIEFIILGIISSLINNLIMTIVGIGLNHLILKAFLIILCDYVIICILNRKSQIYLLFYTTAFYIVHCGVFSYFEYIIFLLKDLYIVEIMPPVVVFVSLIIVLYGFVVGIYKGLCKYNIISKISIVKENGLLLSLINIFILFIYIIIFQWLNNTGLTHIYVQMILSLLIVFWMLLMLILNKIYRLNEKKTENLFMMNIYQNIEQFRKQYEEDEKRIEKLRHDIKNHLLIIKGLDDKEKIQEYVESVYVEYNQIDVSRHDISGNIYVDTIIYSKQLEYPHVMIDYDIHIAGLEMAPLDICTLLFNLIDNACGAANNGKGHVSIQMKYQSPHLIISVKNSYQGEVDFVSKKGTGHGYGMKIIKDLVKKYNGNIEYETLDKEVVVKILLII